MEYRKRLNPKRSFRTPKGIKGTRQKVIVTHNPSETKIRSCWLGFQI